MRDIRKSQSWWCMEKCGKYRKERNGRSGERCGMGDTGKSTGNIGRSGRDTKGSGMEDTGRCKIGGTER
jgi:hypothetical protein